MSGPGWHTNGIDEDIYVAKAYCAISRTMVAQFYSKPEPHQQPIYSIYTKGEKDQSYKKIVPNSELLSYQHFLLAQSEPVIFVNEMEIIKWTKDGEVSYLGYDWIALKKINIKTHEVKTIIDKYDYGPNKGLSDRRLWIWDIVGFDIQNNLLYVTLATEKQVAEAHIKAEYSLSAVDLQTRKIELVRNNVGTAFF